MRGMGPWRWPVDLSKWPPSPAEVKEQLEHRAKLHKAMHGRRPAMRCKCETCRRWRVYAGLAEAPIPLMVRICRFFSGFEIRVRSFRG